MIEKASMKTKPLYILILDGGDGSYYPVYTFDTDVITELESRDLGYGDIGVDGDGFHYDILNVPADCTYESLGITNPFDLKEYDE